MLILGSYLLVVTPNILRLLGSLHNWVVQRISGMMPWFWNGSWEYPLIGEALAEAGMEPIGCYIFHYHTSVEYYISTRSIFDLRLA